MDWKGHEELEIDQDPGLANFDRSDRKFVAVALAHPARPPLLNAVDTDWWHHRQALERCGVQIRFLCPDELGTSPANAQIADALPQNVPGISKNAGDVLWEFML